MAQSHYIAALKLGRRRYQTALMNGEYPYLPVLDEILSYTEIAATVSLGVMDVPLEKIVGTKTSERTNAFANNFMPLLPEKSEFGAKWGMLYDYQIAEGINDPIVAYEFMNQFYVQEGNKRVSVMKYLGAYSISASVTRLVPKRTDEKENRLYYEFLDFYQVSHNCDVWFTKEGSYKKLLKVMLKKEGEEWDEEERMFFRSTYGRFSKAFHMAKGERLELTASDAFLVYMEIFGYDQMKGETEKDMYKALLKIWEEIKLAEGGNQIELIQTPKEAEELGKPSLLNRLIPVGGMTPDMLKIAFIHRKTRETSSWTYGHELGRMYIENKFGGRVKTMAFEGANTDEEVESAIEEAVSKGCNLIFTTAIQMIHQSVRSTIRHPDVKIYNCSIKMSYSSICTYYARMYEAKFLMGAIAAALTKTDRLGYVADYPIYGTVANINAFALGAAMINPNARVQLEWSKVKGQNAREKLRGEGVFIISDDDMITPERASREYGLYIQKDDKTFENLATPIWDWGKFYEQIIRSICRGTAEPGAIKGKKAVNYWWGLSAEVIDVICSGNLPYGTRRLVEFLKESIRTGSLQPFGGVIRAQNGEIRSREGQMLKPDEIITMDWLVENVDGQIPEFEELTEEAQALVQFQGIKIDEADTEE